jgi:hypothetical protein
VALFTTEPSFYILQHSYDMLVRIACSGQHRGVYMSYILIFMISLQLTIRDGEEEIERSVDNLIKLVFFLRVKHPL